jgi:hypothetical protein
MLQLFPPQRSRRFCDGASRRDFLKIGALGLSSMTLAHLFQAQADAQQQGRTVKQKSVVWLWLGGGATQVETFDPKMTAPAEYRSAVGAVKTNVPGIEIGGFFPKMAQVADKLAFVRSFSHTNSGHAGGTHFMMTGYDHPPADNGASPIRPSMGSILQRVRGTNAPSGVPNYVRFGGIYADGPAWLGSAFSPFDVGGEAQGNMNLKMAHAQLDDRKALLKSFDQLNRDIDRTGLMDGLDHFNQQAFGLITSRAREVFDINKESPLTQDRYGRHHLGQWMLTARRLVEAGCGFVTMHYGGWDMHDNIAGHMKNTAPPMDQAVSAFIEDLSQRGLLNDVLLVISGEFGRTPRINGSAGRDHWAPLSPLALAGGGLKMGQVVGESSAKVEVPKTTPITPQDLMATVFHVLNLDAKMQVKDPAGRPTYMVEDGKPIAELV